LNICLLLAGICLLIVPLWNAIACGPFVVALGGVTIVILNIAAYSGYPLGPTLSQHVRPSIQGIVGLSLVGVALLQWALVQQQAKHARSNWLPLLVGLSCITATLILWQALSLKETQRADEMMQFEAVHLQRHLQEEIPGRIKPLMAWANDLARKGTLKTSQND